MGYFLTNIVIYSSCKILLKSLKAYNSGANVPYIVYFLRYAASGITWVILCVCVCVYLTKTTEWLILLLAFFWLHRNSVCVHCHQNC